LETGKLKRLKPTGKNIFGNRTKEGNQKTRKNNRLVSLIAQRTQNFGCLAILLQIYVLVGVLLFG